MDQRALAAEVIGTFMLVSSVLGAALFGVMGAMGVALSIGFTVLALAYSIGGVSGAHFNPAVTIGLFVGGRFEQSKVIGYIVAQSVGAVLAAGVFVYLIGIGKNTNLAGASNGYDALSPNGSGLLSVFVIEFMLTAFLLLVITGAMHKKAPTGFAPIAIGLALTGIHLMAIPVSNASVNPARSLATALWGGPLALPQLWVFWVAPILGGVFGGMLGRWLHSD
jgi:aquaporin Z